MVTPRVRELRLHLAANQLEMSDLRVALDDPGTRAVHKLLMLKRICEIQDTDVELEQELAELVGTAQ